MVPFSCFFVLLETDFLMVYSSSMKKSTTIHNLKFTPGARPPIKLTAAAKKQLDTAKPSLKAHKLAACVAKLKVEISS